MKKVKKSDRLNGKDLMNIGIFAAFTNVVGITVAVTIGMIPLGFMVLGFIGPIINGIPIMLYYTRIKKFGMLLILASINGIIMVLTGMGFEALISGVVLSLIGEFILKSGNYQSSIKAVICYAVISISAASSYIHWVTASAKWLERNAESLGDLYVKTIYGYFSHSWMFPVLLGSAFVGGILGGLLGKTVLKKHFVRSGLV